MPVRGSHAGVGTGGMILLFIGLVRVVTRTNTSKYERAKLSLLMSMLATVSGLEKKI